MSDFTNIYDRPAQPYQKGNYWKQCLVNPKQHRSIIFSPAEIAHITEFINYKSISANISDTRKSGYICILRMFKGFYPGELSTITPVKLFAVVSEINQSNYTVNTKSNIITIVKAFYKYLIKKGYTNSLTIEDINDIKPLTLPASVKKPEDLPTKSNIHAITSDPHCTVMFSAFINTIYYTGGRVSEILTLNWGDIIFENQFVKITIKDTKDNKIRYVPCVQALPFLAAWRRQYPISIIGGPEKNNPVFVTLTDNGYKRLQYMSARNMWYRLQDRSNVHPKNNKKHFGFHTLRAAHITNLAAANVPDAVIRDIAWGNQNTQMMSHYLLLSDKTKEDLILSAAGIEIADDTTKDNAVLLCPKCNAPNGSMDRYCRFCGESLSVDAKDKQSILADAADSTKYVDIIGVLARDLGISKDVLKEKLLKSL